MASEYEDCLKSGKIKKFPRGEALAEKEIEAAVSDFERGRKTFSEQDYKWATIQAYYSMFHSARALLYAKNLREHSHSCLIKAIRELYVSSGKVSAYLIEAFQEAKNLREDADYYDRWSKESSEKLLQYAGEFIESAKKLSRK